MLIRMLMLVLARLLALVLMLSLVLLALVPALAPVLALVFVLLLVLILLALYCAPTLSLGGCFGVDDAKMLVKSWRAGLSLEVSRVLEHSHLANVAAAERPGGSSLNCGWYGHTSQADDTAARTCPTLTFQLEL
jgi:hypothetical protein